MLTTYYTRERTRTMYATAPAGPYLDTFSQWLAQRGFTTRTIRRCLFGATQFTLWAAATDIAVPLLDATHLEAFHGYLAQHGQLHYASGNPTPRCMAHITSSPSSVLRALSRRSRSPRRVPHPRLS